MMKLKLKKKSEKYQIVILDLQTIAVSQPGLIYDRADALRFLNEWANDPKDGVPIMWPLNAIVSPEDFFEFE